MKVINKRNSIIFFVSLIIASTPFASTFIEEAPAPAAELSSLTAEWSESCRSQNGWGESGTTLYCYALRHSINSYNKELN